MKRGRNRDTAFADWWLKTGQFIAMALERNKKPIGDYMKWGFNWGWMERKTEQQRVARASKRRR